jgi:hypothetical protein
MKNKEKTIALYLLRKKVKDITLRQLARILGITNGKSNNIYGLDYKYVDNKIIAFSPDQKGDIRYSYEDVKSFLKCHGLKTMQDIKEYTQTAWYNN